MVDSTPPGIGPTAACPLLPRQHDGRSPQEGNGPPATEHGVALPDSAGYDFLHFRSRRAEPVFGQARPRRVSATPDPRGPATPASARLLLRSADSVRCVRLPLPKGLREVLQDDRIRAPRDGCPGAHAAASTLVVRPAPGTQDSAEVPPAVVDDPDQARADPQRQGPERGIRARPARAADCAGRHHRGGRGIRPPAPVPLRLRRVPARPAVRDARAVGAPPARGGPDADDRHPRRRRLLAAPLAPIIHDPARSLVRPRCPPAPSRQTAEVGLICPLSVAIIHRRNA